MRYRQRYVDLIVNEDARRAFEVRHAVIASIRRSLTDRGFVEVETPVLHVEAGGGLRPTVRHTPQRARHGPLPPHRPRAAPQAARRRRHGARLRDRPRLPQRGIAPKYNPEFTMLEVYQAFADYTDMLTLTEELIVQAARDALGTTIIQIAETTVDLATPWRRAKLLDLVSEVVGQRVHPSMSVAELRALCDRHRVAYEPFMGAGKLCMELYDALVEPTLIAPTFVTKPAARGLTPGPHRPRGSRPRRTVRAGRRQPRAGQCLQRAERPDGPARTVRGEQRAKEAGDVEAGTVDEDYLRALEYACRPRAVSASASTAS